MNNELCFTKQKDAHMKGAAEYLDWLERIKDLLNLNLMVDSPFFKQLNRNGKTEIEVLDLCCGPGVGGQYIENYLVSMGLEARRVVFMDINDDRLSAIPSKSNYHVVNGDVMNYIAGQFDVISLRNAIYYFSPDQQKDLMSHTLSLLRRPGCLVIGSLGGSPE